MNLTFVRLQCNAEEILWNIQKISVELPLTFLPKNFWPASDGMRTRKTFVFLTNGNVLGDFFFLPFLILTMMMMKTQQRQDCWDLSVSINEKNKRKYCFSVVDVEIVPWREILRYQSGNRKNCLTCSHKHIWYIIRERSCEHLIHFVNDGILQSVYHLICFENSLSFSEDIDTRRRKSFENAKRNFNI